MRALYAEAAPCGTALDDVYSTSARVGGETSCVAALAAVVPSFVLIPSFMLSLWAGIGDDLGSRLGRGCLQLRAYPQPCAEPFGWDGGLRQAHTRTPITWVGARSDLPFDRHTGGARTGS